MQLFAFGINHHTAPVSIRERVAFVAERMSDALHDLTRQPQVKEAAILSTCNRTEIYCHTPDPDAPDLPAYPVALASIRPRWTT